MGTRLVFEAITNVIPLRLRDVIAENLEHVECDTLVERVPHLAPGGIMNYAPQVLPRTAVDLLGQNLVPGLSCLFQEEVGVELEDLADNVIYHTLCLRLSLGGR